MYSEPRATSAISDILSLVGDGARAGHAYESAGSVYFDIASVPRVRPCQWLRPGDMLRLAAEHGGNPDDPHKRDPLDFVLWQPSLPDEPAWESRWGPGRPGWHIECSALALRELGETVDIHGGGRDLVFPHHECEAAQSEAVTGKPFVRHWMHVGMVGLDGTKMSKSLGNLVFVGDLCKEWEPAAVRLALLAHHYRGDWDWRTDGGHAASGGSSRPLAQRRRGRRRATVSRPSGPHSTTTWIPPPLWKPWTPKPWPAVRSGREPTCSAWRSRRPEGSARLPPFLAALERASGPRRCRSRRFDLIGRSFARPG